LTIRQGKKKKSITKKIFVFEKKGVLISDQIKNFKEIFSTAGANGIFLEKIIFENTDTGFSAEEFFTQKITEKIDLIREADILIFATKSSVGLRSFSQFWKKFSDENKFNLFEKFWVQISDGNLRQNQKLLQPIFDFLQPKFILLTRPEATSPIFEILKNEKKIVKKFIVEKLKSRAIEHRIVDEFSRIPFFLPFSRMMMYFVKNGISQNVIYLLLAVPFLAFIISFFRQFIGMSTFGVFAPLILSLSCLILGLKFCLLVFVVVLFVSYFIRAFFERVNLLYIPKISLLLSFLSLSFFLVLGIAIYFESSVNLSLAIFPMMVMSTISEKFISAQSSGGTKTALVVAGETIVVSLLGYFFVELNFIKNLILATPELIFIPIFLNFWLGKFTGLRLSEYFRFRSLFREEDLQE